MLWLWYYVLDSRFAAARLSETAQDLRICVPLDLHTRRSSTSVGDDFKERNSSGDDCGEWKNSLLTSTVCVNHEKRMTEKYEKGKNKKVQERKELKEQENEVE